MRRRDRRTTNLLRSRRAADLTPYTPEDVRRAAAYACARVLHGLDHPSGAGEALLDRVIASTRRTEPQTWGTLDPRSFDLSVRAIHHLVLASGDHTYQAALPVIPSPPRTGVLPAAPVVGIVRATDIRHAAISLSHALLGDALHDGLQVSSDPIASQFTLDGPAPTWGELPPRLQHAATLQITAHAQRIQRSVWAAVDAALRSPQRPQSGHGAHPTKADAAPQRRPMPPGGSTPRSNHP
ncbi:hypothetical protein [Streptomyces sp. NPDC093223]|uniref:hypothetical protein n=1 Tax=Streptomyces sp. NPDC093223 TaxID=3366033 RepID=UPI003821E310